MVRIKYSQQGDLIYKSSHQFETKGYFDAPKTPIAVLLNLKINT